MNNKFKTRSSRQGFTLVELLLVIAIIAIIASLGVGVMAQAQNDAAIAATRSRMSMIEKILEVELEDYEVRRSPVSFQSIGTMVSVSSLTNVSGDRTLLHGKNLKRMIIADLIRAEMPDGSKTGDDGVSQFPSDTLLDYLSSPDVGIPRTVALPLFPVDIMGGVNNFTSTLPSVSEWSTWSHFDTADSTINDGIDEEAADKAELLYQILLNIDVDGTPAVELLGSRAIGDTDNDTAPEIIDAWGEPLYLQWQQESITLAGSASDNVWMETGMFWGLSKEHLDSVGTPTLPPMESYCKPVLPTQIRPFLISERLLRIDGLPTDYDPDHTF